MSRIGLKKKIIPDNTEVSVDGSLVKVKGPLGEITRKFNNVVKIEVKGNEVLVTPKDSSVFAKSMWGTASSHIQNMLSGVNKVFEKKLIIEGVGYRASATPKNITLTVGFSHNVDLDIPEGIKVEVEKESIVVSGIDKEQVGSFAAKIRDVKKPEPYKGKGIRYADENIIRKEGKKAV